jgi:carboxyl-terminal processing protease
MRRAAVVGTRMAGLNGGVFTHHLPLADINFTFPGEALTHLNGVPRERFIPPVLVDLTSDDSAGSDDPILAAGIRALSP